MGCANGNTAQNVLNGSGLSDFTACSSATIYRVFCPVSLTGTTDASLTFFRQVRLLVGVSSDGHACPFFGRARITAAQEDEPELSARRQSFELDFEPPPSELFEVLPSDFAPESGFADAASPADLSAFAASLYDLLR